MTSSTIIGTVGSSVTYSCFSDLYPDRIEWYKNGALLSQTSSTSNTMTIDPITIDDEGAVYTCSAISYRKSPERNKTLNVKGIYYIIQCV